MARKRWSELSTPQRVGVATLSTVQIGLAVAAWADLARRDKAQVNGRKATWAAIISINFVGPLSYFRWGRRN
ncbi:PLDc_N domain-containing protein [Rhodococcus triatomae]|uniref:Phospholipase_D-nuclease N-terminal n=1 Tax=Rhodococcus triatomae TaxID=300028 RepID=A0A1G8J8K0_9NOCA|nr:PLD nuclease N-terminal domain-containing protein [Rhodococcus triatomae]QNG19782.1 PLDc_N domain-containing protein [Rhodococcus triatomae]QNG24302.1 PLDc_N domain-containing protein [Rhodococcus triatomae]SDI27589.1 Phospholipase_D-nuclease N-terminal [Rhodococcus triatomae]